MDGKHAKQEDGDEYEGNGHDPEPPIPHDDPGGKHEKDEKDEKE